MSDELDNTKTHSPAGWSIGFRPNAGLLATCNDPKRLFRELHALGELTVQSDLSSLPAFSDLAPEELFIGWQLTLGSGVEEAAIREVFAWVIDNCELQLSPVTTPTELPSSTEETLPEIVQDSASKTSVSAISSFTDESSSIRINTDKVDALVNLIGELVITQSMLNTFRSNHEFDLETVDSLHAGLAELMRNTRELQESVMAIRMLPISFAFSQLPGLVRNLGNQLGKKVELKLDGEDTEVDKAVLDKISEPLLQLVRNALDHGIETPAERAAAGKSETGALEVKAFHEGGNIVIQVTDDGAGVNREKVLAKARQEGRIGADEQLSDEQINNLIFGAGFSAAEYVSDISGGDVGMDVVRNNIKALGGTIQIESEAGAGSRITIHLPLTLSILEGQLVHVGDQTYIVPLVSIVETTQVTEENVGSVVGASQVFKLRDEYIPVIRLHEVFGVDPESRNLADGLLVIVSAEGQRAGVFVDELGDQQQVVIKSLSANFRPVEGLSGATILANGTVALIIDVASLMTILSETNRQGHLAASAAA